MSSNRLRLPLGGAMLFLIFAAALADDVPEPADDPLPEGAVVRFGTTRPILRTGPTVALVPPAYKDFLAPTMTGGVRRYNLATGRPLEKEGIVGPGQVVVSANGKRAAVARPGAVTVVEVAGGKQLLAVEPPEGVVVIGTPGVSLSEDGTVLAYAGQKQDGKAAVVVWDVDKNELLTQVGPDLAFPVFPLLSRDGKTLVTHGPPPPPPSLNAKTTPPPMPVPALPPDMVRTAQVWEVEGGKELFKARVSGMGGAVVAAAFSPAGDVLALSAGDGPLDLWDVKNGKLLRTLLGRKGQGVRVAFSPDGKTVASVASDFRIQRWSAEGKPLGVTVQPGGMLTAAVSGLTFADNERVIGWATSHQFAVAWEGPTSRLLSPATEHIAAIQSIALPQGKDPHTSGQDGRVLRWDFATGQRSESITLHPAHLPFQPRVLPVVHLSADATLAIWQRAPAEIFDLSTGEDLFCVPPPSAPQAAVGFGHSADGKTLVTVSRQGGIKRTGSCVVWDLAGQERLGEFDILPSTTAAAPLAVFSPDKSKLVVVAMTRGQFGVAAFTLAGFDIKTGEKFAEVQDPTASGNISVAAASETEAVLTSSTGRVWTADYVQGTIGKDIEKLPVAGEPPLHGQVAFSADGKRFAVGVVGKAFTTYGVRVYDWTTRKPLHTFVGHLGPVSALRFSADGRYLASGAQDTSVLIWDLNKIPGDK